MSLSIVSNEGRDSEKDIILGWQILALILLILIYFIWYFSIRYWSSLLVLWSRSRIRNRTGRFLIPMRSQSDSIFYNLLQKQCNVLHYWNKIGTKWNARGVASLESWTWWTVFGFTYRFPCLKIRDRQLDTILLEAASRHYSAVRLYNAGASFGPLDNIEIFNYVSSESLSRNF